MILEIKKNIIILLEDERHHYDYDEIFDFILIDPYEEKTFRKVYC